MELKTTKRPFRLGIDLGGSKTEVVVLDHRFEVQHRRRVKTHSTDYEAILDTISTLVYEADKLFECQLPVGIGTPGAISPRNNLLRNSNTVCMNDRPFKSDIEALLNRSVRVQNDANCFVLSEALNGAAKVASVVFGVIIGTGTGGGLVVNGRLLEGKHRITGEWGHNPMPWQRDSDCKELCYCAPYNSIEKFLSCPGLSIRYLKLFVEHLNI